MSSDVSGMPPATKLTEQMWRELLSQMRAFVRRRISDPHRADDVVAEILLRVHQSIGSLDDHERLPNWMFRIARNAIIDEYRRMGRNREQLTATLPDDAADDRMDEDEPSAVPELAACLRPLLDGLPADQRDAVEMVDLEGRTQADVAAQVGVSVSGMKSRVQRGRRRLADLLGQCCALTLDGRGVPMDYEPPPDCGCDK